MYLCPELRADSWLVYLLFVCQPLSAALNGVYLFKVARNEDGIKDLAIASPLNKAKKEKGKRRRTHAWEILILIILSCLWHVLQLHTLKLRQNPA